MQYLVELRRVQVQIPTDRFLVFLLQVEAREDLPIAWRAHRGDDAFHARGHLALHPVILGSAFVSDRIELRTVGARAGPAGHGAPVVAQQIDGDLEDVARDLFRPLDLAGLPLLPGDADRLAQEVGSYVRIAGAARDQQAQAGIVLADQGLDG